jgi:signal transduction histidine kinase
MELDGRTIFGTLILLLCLAALYFLSATNYLLFHSLVELFSILIAFSIFLVAWNARRFLENHYLMFLGLIYPFVGALDLIHTLAYKGMGVFPGNGANLPTQLWIQARYLESVSLLIAPFLMHRKVREKLVLAVYTGLTGFLLASIFVLGIFPDCYVEPQGLTPFKVTSEYAIVLILALSLTLVVHNRGYFSRRMFVFITMSILSTMVSEIAFTFYVSVYGISNMVGHLFKVLSFFLIYRGLIETGLKDPYRNLFMDLKRSEESLLRTQAELFQKNKDLQAFVHTAGHDLSTPVTSAQAYAQLLQKRLDGKLNDQETHMMGRLLFSLNRLQAFLKDLLDFARLELDSERVVTIDTTHLLRSVVEDKRRDIHRLGAEVTLADDLPNLRMSETRAYQLFMNLISNGLKFTRDGVVPRIEVGIQGVDGGPGDPPHRTFYVRDNGRGIEQDQQERVFELFYSTDKDSGMSSGAGLAIVKKIIEREGEGLRMDSTPGEGTTFYLDLPVEEEGLSR